MKNQRKPIELKVGVKPVLNALIHSDAKEGPCRTGRTEDLSPDKEKQRAKKIFDNLKSNLKDKLIEEARILEPLYFRRIFVNAR